MASNELHHMCGSAILRKCPIGYTSGGWQDTWNQFPKPPPG
jgi:hypothetical protein